MSVSGMPEGGLAPHMEGSTADGAVDAAAAATQVAAASVAAMADAVATAAAAMNPSDDASSAGYTGAWGWLMLCLSQLPFIVGAALLTSACLHLGMRIVSWARIAQCKMKVLKDDLPLFVGDTVKLDISAGPGHSHAKDIIRVRLIRAAQVTTLPDSCSQHIAGAAHTHVCVHNMHTRIAYAFSTPCKTNKVEVEVGPLPFPGEYEATLGSTDTDILGQIVFTRVRFQVQLPRLEAGSTSLMWREDVVPHFSLSRRRTNADAIVLVRVGDTMTAGIRKTIPRGVTEYLPRRGYANASASETPQVVFSGKHAPQAPSQYELLYTVSLPVLDDKDAPTTRMQDVVVCISDTITVAGPSLTPPQVFSSERVVGFPYQPVTFWLEVSPQHAPGDVVALVPGAVHAAESAAAGERILGSPAIAQLKVPPTTVAKVAMTFQGDLAPHTPGIYTLVYVNESRQIMCCSEPFRVATPRIALLSWVDCIAANTSTQASDMAPRTQADAGVRDAASSAPLTGVPAVCFRSPIQLLVLTSPVRRKDTIALCRRGEKPGQGVTVGSVISLTPSAAVRQVNSTNMPGVFDTAVQMLGPLVGRCGEVLQITFDDDAATKVPGLYAAVYATDPERLSQMRCLSMKSEHNAYRVVDDTSVPPDGSQTEGPGASGARHGIRADAFGSPAPSRWFSGWLSSSATAPLAWHVWGPVFASVGPLLRCTPTVNAVTAAPPLWSEVVSADVRTLLPLSTSGIRGAVPDDRLALAFCGAGPLLSASVALDRSTMSAAAPAATGSAGTQAVVMTDVPALRRYFDTLSCMPPLPGKYEFVYLAGVDDATCVACSNVIDADELSLVKASDILFGQSARMGVRAVSVAGQRNYVELARSEPFVVRFPTVRIADATEHPEIPPEQQPQPTGLMSMFVSRKLELPKPRILAQFTTSTAHGPYDCLAIARAGGDPDEPSTVKLRIPIADSRSADGSLLFERNCLPTTAGNYEVVYLKGMPPVGYLSGPPEEYKSLFEAIAVTKRVGLAGGMSPARNGGIVLARSAPFTIELSPYDVPTVGGVPLLNGEVPRSAVRSSDTVRREPEPAATPAPAAREAARTPPPAAAASTPVPSTNPQTVPREERTAGPPAPPSAAKGGGDGSTAAPTAAPPPVSLAEQLRKATDQRMKQQEARSTSTAAPASPAPATISGAGESSSSPAPAARPATRGTLSTVTPPPAFSASQQCVEECGRAAVQRCAGCACVYCDAGCLQRAHDQLQAEGRSLAAHVVSRLASSTSSDGTGLSASAATLPRPVEPPAPPCPGHDTNRGDDSSSVRLPQQPPVPARAEASAPAPTTAPAPISAPAPADRAAPAADASSGLGAADAERVAKYEKMKKMGVPVEAIAAKMAADGIDIELIRVVTGSAAGEVVAPPQKAAPAAPAAPARGRTLTRNEDDRHARSRTTMLEEIRQRGGRLASVPEGKEGDESPTAPGKRPVKLPPPPKAPARETPPTTAPAVPPSQSPAAAAPANPAAQMNAMQAAIAAAAKARAERTARADAEAASGSTPPPASKPPHTRARTHAHTHSNAAMTPEQLLRDAIDKRRPLLNKHRSDRSDRSDDDEWND